MGGPLGRSPEPLLGTFATDIVSFAHCVSAALSPSGLRLLPQPRSVAPGSTLAKRVKTACPPPSAAVCGRGHAGEGVASGRGLGGRRQFGGAEAAVRPQDLSRFIR